MNTYVHHLENAVLNVSEQIPTHEDLWKKYLMNLISFWFWDTSVHVMTVYHVLFAVFIFLNDKICVKPNVRIT